MIKLGKYEIRRELGKGAMGIVYEGFDPMIERRVAIKTILPDNLNALGVGDAMARFKREAQAAGRLNHPGIVAVYDYGEEATLDANGAPSNKRLAYIAMEFVQGRELSSYFDNNQRFSLPDIARIMAEILDALGHAHAHGVVHRDMKPGNLFVLENGKVKIGDFGIARVESSELTQVGTVMGTPAYMSPEQILSQPVDGRSDIFSCGVILYQLLTGEKPFTGSQTTIMYKVLNEVPLAPSMLNVTLPRTLDAVVSKAMAKMPEQRYQTAQEFSSAIQAALNAPDDDQTIVRRVPAVADSAPPMAQAQPPRQQPRLAGRAVSLGNKAWPRALMAGVVVLVAASYFANEKDGPRPPDPPPAPVSQPADKVSLPARPAEPATPSAAGQAQESGKIVSNTVGVAHPKSSSNADAAKAEVQADSKQRMVEEPSVAQQKEAFDLLSFTLPEGFTQDFINAEAVAYKSANIQNGSFCTFGVFKSMSSLGSVQLNFETDWQNFIVRAGGNKVTARPKTEHFVLEAGWEAILGSAPFDSSANSVAMLLTMSGNGRRMSVGILTNSREYEPAIKEFIASMKLQGQKDPIIGINGQNKRPTGVTPSSKTISSNFTYTTSNFNDGWTSTAGPEYVQVARGNTKVLIHYKNSKADEYNSSLEKALNIAWNIFISTRYSYIKNYAQKSINSWESLAFAEADAIENKTGKNVHIVLFKKFFSTGKGNYLEFITPSKSDFEREFGIYDSSEFWNNLTRMQSYNSFAISKNDLVGQWGGSQTSAVELYHVYDGTSAGMNSAALSDEFIFQSNGSYQSIHSGAVGQVGNIKFNSQTYKGKFQNAEYEIILTNRFKNKTDTFIAYFEATKGGRILHMQDKNSAGTSYHLFKKN